MTRLKPVALLALISMLGAAKPPRQQDARSILDRAITAWAKVRTVRASFDQVLLNPITGSDLKASGAYQQQRPGKLSVTFTEPAGDRIVADGKNLWLYLPSTTPGQVIRQAQGDEGAAGVDLSAQFLSRTAAAKYDVKLAGAEKVGDRPAKVLALTARAGSGLPFTNARVWVDDADGFVRQFEIVEASGVTRRIRLTSLVTNGKVDAGAFRFAVPAGSRVVDR
ncbi:MAG: outer rane lipoprotein carrier protein LolA [Gemmatimonadetes bacterium]|nr:outer rane lipoprotein carrier protein LolA [Gemmatimonadota bacterium]